MNARIINSIPPVTRADLKDGELFKCFENEDQILMAVNPNTFHISFGGGGKVEGLCLDVNSGTLYWVSNTCKVYRLGKLEVTK